MEIQWYVLGSPPLVGPSFGCPPPLFRASLTHSLLPSLPSHSPYSLSLLPHSQWPREGRVCYTMFWCPHHLFGGKRLGGKLGARGSEMGARGVRQMLY